MRAKDRKWLEQIEMLCRPGVGGMYNGMTVDRLPQSVALRLGAFIRSEFPHNPVHKERWIITDEGRKALASTN